MRTSGILMPISCLPSSYGIGSLGKEAYHFIDFLKKSGQHYWQILPIGPTSYGDSPYQSFSAFAFNPYFIDLDMLIEEGLLTKEEVAGINWGDNKNQVGYLNLFENRFTVLRKAVNRLSDSVAGFAAFKESNADWLHDYALYMAVKSENGMRAFNTWPEPLRQRQPEALAHAETRLALEVNFWSSIQYLFFRQWVKLKTYANENGVYFIGDIPIYVSPDSSDLWAHSELFQVDENKNATEVAGCPPDAFSSDGQLWGNPLYNWSYHQKTGYDWWIRRLKYAGSIYDVVRIDHFRGFAGYYSIPAQNKTAAGGTWRRGPGLDLIRVIKEKLPGILIIAEDLGYLTDDVKNLLAQSGFPGMKVLQFAFDSREAGDYLPHNYSRNSVVYTGTHDNTTTRDWQYSAPLEDVAFAKEYLNINERTDFTYSFIRAALGSVCDTAIIPIQDWLRLGKEARINTPSTLGGNWVWRMPADTLTTELSAVIYRFTQMFGRLAP